MVETPGEADATIRGLSENTIRGGLPLGSAATRTTWLTVALLGLVGVATAFVEAPDGHRYVPLFEVGRVLTSLGALACAALLGWSARRGEAPRPLLTAAGLITLTFGLAALIARHTHDFRLFASAHPGTLGVPSELFLVALSAGLALSARDTHHASRPTPTAAGSWLLALGLGLSTACLIAPDSVLGAPRTALADGLSRGPTHAIFALAALATVLVGLATALNGSALRLPPTLQRALHAAQRAAPLALALVALGPALSSETPLHGLLWVLALVALHLALVGFASAGSAGAAGTAGTGETTHGDRWRPARHLTEAVALAAILGAWLLIKSHALIASNTDENIYFYMARILGDGQWPYADYFFAHPPLHVLLPGLLFSTFGFSLTFAKVLPLAFTLIGGLALYATLRRPAAAPGIMGPAGAALALCLYLFGCEVLKASSNMTGVNMTTMFLLLGTWQFVAQRPLTAGLLLGLAPATGFYAMAPALAIIAMGLFRAPALPSPTARAKDSAPTTPPPHPGPWRRLFRQVGRWLTRLRQRRLATPLAFVLTLGGINLVFWAIGGETFLEGVYAYHQQKFFQEPDMVEIFGGDPGFPLSIIHNLGVMLGSDAFTKELFYHPHLWLAGLLLPLVVLAAWLSDPERRRRLHQVLSPSRLFTTGPDGWALFFGLVALSLFIEFAMFRELYSFYFALIYPWLAVAAAFVIWRAVSLLRPVAPGSGEPAPTPSTPTRPGSTPRTRTWLWPLITSALALTSLVVIQGHASLALRELVVFQDELEGTLTRNDYDWTPAPVLTALSPVVRNLFWEDFRFKGDVEPGHRHYLWTKKRGFSRLEEVAEHIRSRSRPDETLAGSSTLAPLVALMAERRIAANEVDTNNKRFRTGILSERDYWNAICADGLRFVVSAPRSYFTLDKMRSLPVIARYFGEPTLFEDRALLFRSPFPIAIFERRTEAPCVWIE